MSGHTPTPYRIGEQNDAESLGPPGEIAIMADVRKGIALGPNAIPTIRDSATCIAVVSPCGGRGDRYPELTRANAEFIVRACNLHDRFLAACRLALKRLGAPITHYQDALAALTEVIAEAARLDTETHHTE